MSTRTCSDCGCTITKMSRTGRCRDCYLASLANAPTDAETGSARLRDAILTYHARQVGASCTR